MDLNSSLCRARAPIMGENKAYLPALPNGPQNDNSRIQPIEEIHHRQWLIQSREEESVSIASN